MALSGSRHAATGTAVALSTLVPTSVKQLDIIADSGNAANIYVGSSAVTTAGVAAFICLAPGQSWTVKANPGDEINLGSSAYIIGTASDVAYLAYIGG